MRRNKMRKYSSECWRIEIEMRNLSNSACSYKIMPELQ